LEGFFNFIKIIKKKNKNKKNYLSLVVMKIDNLDIQEVEIF